ncbi:hypothetical protein FB561_6487 [Kribbella amoyensis]|uniref:Uncharacterized protein n=1 Tax=Kribbella amoyensis TaxID=996641 RepID=A0A561B7W2_9ACTN|nr:hypothetical protein [Kribbella amoyensis]TWD75051.1 hypothetical protein FB561_6487 [Kribbella amoyensis]
MATTDRTPTLPDVPGGPPVSVRAATTAWFLAVGAGVAESVLGAAGWIADGRPILALVAQIALRTIVYGGLFLIIDRYFRHGVPWSRWLLAGLLGVVGMASLLIGPISWLTSNGDFGRLDLDASFLTLAALRVVHVLAVAGGVVLMFLPDSNRWFRRKA